jgi:hypothetical protein
MAIAPNRNRALDHDHYGKAAPSRNVRSGF